MNLPRPVSYISRIPVVPTISPPVGKSGPGILDAVSETLHEQPSRRYSESNESVSTGLCGGMFVAIPTAIPDAPLISRFGRTAGRTEGSVSDSSKFGTKFTVSSSTSACISSPSGARRTSV